MATGEGGAPDATKTPTSTGANQVNAVSKTARHGTMGQSLRARADHAGAFGLRAPPANDTCANAITLACGASVTVDVTEATEDGADPVFSCAFFGPDTGFNTVWYKFVAPSGGAVTLGACSSPDDTLLGIYSGSCGSLTEVVCNDDGCDGTLQSDVSATGLIPGQIYYAQLSLLFPYDAGFGDIGTEFLSLTCPSNLPQGACCVGAACTRTSQADCTGLGGAWTMGAPCLTLGTTVTTYTSNPNIAIPDSPAPAVTDSIVVTDTALTGDINVSVNIPDHTYIGDLEITLTRGATSVVVFNGCGPENGLTATFDDEGAALACAQPTTGTFRPAFPLSAFDGAPLNGTYTLSIRDTAGADTGTFVGWSLITTNGNPTCTGGNPCPADWNVDGEVNGNDISDYINSWYLDIVSGSVIADFNGDGETNGNDISDYINAWYAAIVNGGFCA